MCSSKILMHLSGLHLSIFVESKCTWRHESGRLFQHIMDTNVTRLKKKKHSIAHLIILLFI